MVNIGLKSILKRKRGPPGGLAGAPNPTHGLCSPGKQAQPTKNQENTAPARAPALISKIQDWGGWGLGAGGWGHLLIPPPIQIQTLVAGGMLSTTLSGLAYLLKFWFPNVNQIPSCVGAPCYGALNTARVLEAWCRSPPEARMFGG